MDRITFCKMFAYDSTFNHLTNGLNDPRKKERMRSRIGLKTLAKWYKQGEEEYDRRLGEAKNSA